MIVRLAEFYRSRVCGDFGEQLLHRNTRRSVLGLVVQNTLNLARDDHAWEFLMRQVCVCVCVTLCVFPEIMTDVPNYRMSLRESNI